VSITTAAELERWSKFLSFVLRHNPESIGIVLDAQGWTPIDEFLERCVAAGKPMTAEMLRVVVSTGVKQRFAISDDGKRVRASQGHSVAVDLGYDKASPPAVLYHGTVSRSLARIRSDGLLKMERHHVHLSAEPNAATTVGARRGAPVVLRVDAAAMVAEGHVFYMAANGVWLTEQVPPRFIEFPDA